MNNCKTHFIYLKKKDINNLDDVRRKINIDIDLNNTIIVNNSIIKSFKSNNIGNLIKSEDYICDICNKKIYNQCKILKCNHKFHIKCINKFLYCDIYKKCYKCKIEHITDLLKDDI